LCDLLLGHSEMVVRVSAMTGTAVVEIYENERPDDAEGNQLVDPRSCYARPPSHASRLFGLVFPALAFRSRTVYPLRISACIFLTNNNFYTKKEL
jgi:hypothetical protein